MLSVADIIQSQGKLWDRSFAGNYIFQNHPKPFRDYPREAKLKNQSIEVKSSKGRNFKHG